MSGVDCVVIGAGVIGLAVARALAARGLDTLILEGESQFGSWTSSRNSEVIHAGIYYPQGSLKAQLCIEGRQRLYAYCESRAVPHRACSKLIVASDESQVGELDRLAAAAAANGVEGMSLLSGSEALRLEPALRCVAALQSSTTGIIDSHAYMTALLAESEANGAQLVCGTRVERLDRSASGWAVSFSGGDEPLQATRVVNAGGLAAQSVAAAVGGLDGAHIPTLTLAKGVYFTYGGKVPFQRLIYPVPEPGGLGTHLTLDLAGQGRFGPDVEWVDAIDYSVDPARKDRFASSIHRFWPDADISRLEPGYAGVRPKLSGPGEPAADFVISGPAQHGLPGLVNLFGIESPGLTASLAIAERVSALI